jgi:hypothetical protein
VPEVPPVAKFNRVVPPSPHELISRGIQIKRITREREMNLFFMNLPPKIIYKLTE